MPTGGGTPSAITFGGCEVGFKFPIVKLLDYKTNGASFTAAAPDTNLWMPELVRVKGWPQQVGASRPKTSTRRRKYVVRSLIV